MAILTVVGNRPQFVKAAAVSHRLRERAEEILVHTGQHYDRELSAIFFEELALPPPDRDLGAGSGSHATQTAAILTGLEPLVTELRPEAMLIYGDTNSTLAAALVAAKLGVPLAHVEAGMRSFNRAMPEEINRLVADRVSDLLLCSTETAVENLRHEGIEAGVALVGDVMADVAAIFAPIAEARSEILERLQLAPGSYLLATVHRQSNVDDPLALAAVVELLSAPDAPVIFPVHPRTRERLSRAGLMEKLAAGGVAAIEPLGYLDFTKLLGSAQAVLTDSGGLQKEAYLAGVPCVTLREETEWVETVSAGWNRLVGRDSEAALSALAGFASEPPATRPDAGVYGDGRAGERVASAVARLAAGTAQRPSRLPGP